MSRYKIGDKVRVRSDLVYGIYGKCSFVERMNNLIGKYVTISHVLDDFYYVEEDKFMFAWSDEMFEQKSKSETVYITNADLHRLMNGIKVSPVKVIYNDPATIFVYKNRLGNQKKSVAKCLPTDEFIKEKGLKVALLKALIKEAIYEIKKI